ncbi:MAG: hypothetical protein JW874_12515 [Spirochaetales bacterium]|nr:hypothetical protein [Spirochaetales bacterium]
MEKSKNLFWPVLFWGAVWGITEATLGYVLHFFSLFPGFSGILLFPFAVYILRSLYRQTGSSPSLVFCGFVAASIKCIDFVFPALPWVKTFNPVAAILIEAAICALLVPRFSGLNTSTKILAVITASTAWRLLFIGINVFVFQLSGGGILKYGTETVVRFILVDGLIGALLVLAAMRIPVISGWMRNRRYFPIFAAAVFSVAAGVEILFLLV